MQEEMDEISCMNASITHILPKSGRQASSPLNTAVDPEYSVASSIDSPRGSMDITRNGTELLPPHIQELITRLTHENRMLKRNLKDAPETTEKIELLKTELEDEQRRRADLESENRYVIMVHVIPRHNLYSIYTVSGHFVLCHFNRCNFNRSHIQPRAISTACNFNRRKFNRLNYLVIN